MNINNFKYISIDIIASRILKHPLLKDMNYEDVISHTVDVLRLVKIPRSYVEESCYKDIVDYKVKIPTEALNIKAVDFVESGHLYPMKIATDTLHNHHENIKDDRNDCVYTYSMNNGMIHTNQEEGIVFIVYDVLKCSEDGFPMIPDDIDLVKAIEAYIKVQVFSVLVDLQKINNNSLNREEQNYSWYIGKAQKNFQAFQNEDDLESFLADFQRLFIQNKTHRDRHMYNVNREIRYKN